MGANRWTGPEPVLTRFFRHIGPGAEGCWEWQGARNRSGYGAFGNREDGRPRVRLAHRVSWELHVGPIPDGLFVCHRCDNPPCVNPSHLFIGTAKDNQRDRRKKGRGPAKSTPGELNGQAKLTWAQVGEIRALRQQGATLRFLAEQFDISQVQISKIVKNRSWVLA